MTKLKKVMLTLVSIGFVSLFSFPSQADGPALTAIKQDGKIRVGMYLGFEGLSFTEKGENQGLEVELVTLLTDELSEQLKTPIKVEIIDQEWSQIIKVLRDGKYDIVFSAVIPSQLYNSYNIIYTQSYLDTGPVITSQRKDKESATGVAAGVGSLAGKRVVVINDPAVRKVLREAGVYVLGDVGKTDLETAFPLSATEDAVKHKGGAQPLVSVKEIIQLDDMATIYKMIADGEVDAGVIDLGIIWYVANESRRYSKKIFAYDKPVGPYIYSAVTRAEDKDLRDILDAAIVNVKAKPQYKAILAHWHSTSFNWNLKPEDFLK